jgi:hypothetical protein
MRGCAPRNENGQSVWSNSTENIRGLELLELCPRGNNKDVIIIILVHDNVYIPC